MDVQFAMFVFNQNLKINNKCTKTYQLVNSYLANIPTATA